MLGSGKEFRGYRKEAKAVAVVVKGRYSEVSPHTATVAAHVNCDPFLLVLERIVSEE